MDSTKSTMKKICFLFTMAVAFVTTISNAQQTVVVYPQGTVVVALERTSPDPRDRFYIGLKGGFCFASVYDTERENFDADIKPGFAGGVFISIPIGSFLGIQPELLFAQKGFKARGTLLDNPYRLTRTTYFIDVPLFIAMKPAPFITLLVGPQFSYLFRQRDEFEGNAENSVVEEEFRNDNIRKNILCFTGGFDFNLNRIIIGARAGLDVLNNIDDNISSTPRYKNVWMQAALGVRF